MAERAIAAVFTDLRTPALADEFPASDPVQFAARNISRKPAARLRHTGVVPLRIAFDLDGVLADMESELVRQAHILFGTSMKGQLDLRAVEDAKAIEPVDDFRVDAAPESQTLAESLTDNAPALVRLNMTWRQQRRLWRHVESIDGFWERLREIEPGTLQRLAAIATDRRWEIIFLTRRPNTRGATAQVQTQRWLESQGFTLPSVFVVQGSRGRIAAALDLDIVVDDRPENCLDVVVDSKARAILVCREDEKHLPAATRRLGIGVVKSVAECLDILTELDSAAAREQPGVMNRVMRLLGLKEPASA
jgi:hypothetical protein